MPQKAILAGGSGFLGRAVARRLVADGWEVLVLSRDLRGYHPSGDNHPRVRTMEWDARAVGPWAEELATADALVNFTGRTVNCVHTPENRREILNSRIESVRVLGAALARMARRPAAWVQCSGAGFYGPRDDERCGEATPAGNDFLAQVCRQWEEEFISACPADVRPVRLRLGMVLGRDGGAFPLLSRLARVGLGGAAGHGRQGMSWVHQEDVVEIFARAATDESWRGAYNACAPEPLANAEFMRALRRAVHRPWSPPAPAFMVRLIARHILRTDPSLVLTGQFAVPERLSAAGFRFRFPRAEQALADLASVR